MCLDDTVADIWGIALFRVPKFGHYISSSIFCNMMLFIVCILWLLGNISIEFEDNIWVCEGG
jgi:accessory gene regulator protein AgrB